MMTSSASCNKAKPLGYRFCHKCLKKRYGDDTDTVPEWAEWICPRCRRTCSDNMKKKVQLLPISASNNLSLVSEIFSRTAAGGSSAEEPINVDDDLEITDRMELEMCKEIDVLKNRVLSRVIRLENNSADNRTPKDDDRNQIRGSSGDGSYPKDVIDVDELHELQMKKEMERDREIERLRERIAETDAKIKRLKSMNALTGDDRMPIHG